MKLQSRNLAINSQGDDVRLLHQELRLLGFRGIPASEARPSVFGPKTEAAVRKFQEKAGLQVTGIVNRATARAINEQTSDLPETARSEAGAESTHAASEAEAAAENSSTYTVTGTVTSSDSAAVGGLHVEIVDKNVGPDADVLLASTETDARGRYRVKFSIPPGKAQPDLQVRVFLNEKPEKPLATSEVRYNAGLEEAFDVTLPANLADLPSEYETLTSALGAHYKGNMRDLQESDGRQDFTYLANKSGFDTSAVAMVTAADELGSEAAIHPAFYYALLRAGLPAQAETLHLADLKTVRDVWKLAFEQRVIPKELEAQMPRAEEAFHDLAAAHILDSRAVAGTSSFKEMVQLTLANPKQQRRFAELYVRHRGDLPTFWKEATKPQAEGGVGPNGARRLQLDGQLGVLTLNNAPLMKSLRGSVASPVDLVKGGYHRAETWKPLLKESPVPEQIPGATLEEKRANYAESMAAQVRLSFPTAVIAERIKRNEIKMAPDVKDQVIKFLTEQQGKFEIGKQPVEQLFASTSLTSGTQTPAPQVIEQVKRLERVYQIAPTDQAMVSLLNSGTSSAYEIVRYEEEEFVRLFKDKLGGEEQARLTYANAQQVHNTVLNVAVSYLLTRNAPALGLTQDASVLPATGSDILAYPTLETLFGSMDFCACEHCRSVLSPAAYLVDLLQFLDHPEAGDKNPQKVLLERRPDIQHLPLTCENTNTPVPYIDLVNEVLEYFVVHDSLTGYPGHDTGDRVPPEELLASPQFVEESAYNKLRFAAFPAPLPFHKPLETLRRYLAKLEVPLHEAMEAFLGEPAVGYTGPEITMERLKLSRGDYSLLADRRVTFPQIYGYPSEADALRELVKVKVFARRAGVSYEEVVELLKTQFIRRLGPITLTNPAGGGQPSSFADFELRVSTTNPLRPIHYIGLLRFIRLCRKLGLTIDQTDRLTAALYPETGFPAGGNDTTDLERLDGGFWTLLNRISATFHIMERLKLTPERGLQDLLACWSPPPAGGTSTIQDWLARNLRLSVVELQSLMRRTGLNPFSLPDPGNPQMVRFLDFLEALRAASLKPVQALYLIWNEDVSGKSVPDDRLIADLANSLRAGFAAIESDLTAVDNPDGKSVRKRQQALATVSAALRTDPAFTEALLSDKDVLHAAADTAKPAFDDLLALESATGTGASISFNHLRSTVIRLLKVWSLASALKMTVREIIHFATRTEYRIGGQGWLNALADAGQPDAATSRALGDVLTALLVFARLKSELSPDDERLLAVLQNPQAVLADGKDLLLSLTGWEAESLNALLVRFGLTAPPPAPPTRTRLSRVEVFRRVHHAYAMAKKLGVPVSTLLNAVTNELNMDTVRGLQSALRTRYDASGWLDFIRPIHDELRGLGRDALVAYVLHKLSANPDTRHIDTPDKLFEYFLTDVEMEPCMQTTRIRHELSTVQLFIERCLMNLEPRVAPSVINAGQWEWMKRYRVWEANRKVFLWPENWLEPELRDDQSPIFKETMSELLQGDITEDTATTCLLNYLSKLEEVAKLEPCGIHYVENEPDTADDVAHVVARTAGARRKYYYRRREGGFWTPWEPIQLDIEDNPVIPIVWKGRLLLFWFKILKKGPEDLQTPPVASARLSEVTRADIANLKVEITMQAVLCWSEYYNGKWQPAKTSDVNKPGELGRFQSEPDRSKLLSGVSEEGTEEKTVLRIWLQVPPKPPLSFLFYNTHSVPVPTTDRFQHAFSLREERFVDREPTLRNVAPNQLALSDFSIDYQLTEPSGSNGSTRWLRKILLKYETPWKTCQPGHPLQDAWIAPFLFEDSRHVFYVMTTTRLPEPSAFGVSVRAAESSLVRNPQLALPTLVGGQEQQGPIAQGERSGNK